MRNALQFALAMILCATSTLAADKLQFSECTQATDLSQPVLVIDLRAYPKGKATASFIEDRASLTRLESLLEKCPNVDLGRANAFLASAVKAGSENARLIVAPPTTIRVYVFHQGALADIEVEEKQRDITIVTDFGDLIDLINAARAKASPAAGSEVSVFQADYALTEQRATVTFFAVINGEATKENKPQRDKVAVATTGGIEHFRLSADLPVNTVKQLDYDKDSHAPKLKEVPREFLVGFDWYWGDVLKSYDYRTVGGWTTGQALRRLGVKGLAKFSNEPLNSIGIVGAFRADSFSLFAGPVWNRQTEKVGTNPDGTDKTKAGYQMKYRVGIGFDLSKALGWVKK